MKYKAMKILLAFAVLAGAGLACENSTTLEEGTATVELIEVLETEEVVITTGSLRVAQLVADNGGCQFPCWWGITPGATSLTQAEEIIGTGAFLLEYSQLDAQTVLVDTVHEYPDEAGDMQYVTARYLVRDGVVVEVRPLFSGPPEGYALGTALAAFGQPEEVWLWAVPGEEAAILLGLFYREQGVMLPYSGEVTVEGETLRACFEGLSGQANLVLWQPGMYGAFEEVQPGMGGSMYPLEEAAGMDAAAFYEAFSGGSGAACVEMGVGDWGEWPE